jgi:hypothetical protein
VFASIAVLVSGVVLLSLKSSAKTAGDPYTVTTESNSIHLRPQAPRAQHSKGSAKDDDAENGYRAPGGNDVMWEVGSVSDSEDGKDDEGKRIARRDGREETEEPEDEQQPERRGVGGVQNGRGERRGLLGEEEELDDDTVYVQPGPSRG